MSNPDYLDPNEESGEIIQSTPSALAVLNQSEHAAMVITANLPANRRTLGEFGKRLMSYATHSQPVAISMFYTLPRAGKQIVGPGVRFAEIVAPCWKNNSAGSRVMGSTDESVTAQGVFIDYENNVRNTKEIPRRITDKDGRKFNSDMIMTTAKAVLSIAYREAILKGGVPMALWNPAYEQAKLTAVGSAVSHSQRIDAAMEYLNKLGVTEWQICNSVGVTSPKEMEIDHLVTLKTLCEEIKKGARTIEDVFGSPFDKEIEALFTQLKKNETEKGLLRNSYMGRAKDLVEYLRSRVTSGATQGTPSTPKTEPQTTEKTEPKQEPQQTGAPSAESQPTGEAPKRGRGRPRKDAGTTPQTESSQEENPETAQAEPEQAAEKQPDAQEVPSTGSFNF